MLSNTHCTKNEVLRIFPLNVTRPGETVDLVTFTEEILNRKLHCEKTAKNLNLLSVFPLRSFTLTHSLDSRESDTRKLLSKSLLQNQSVQ